MVIGTYINRFFSKIYLSFRFSASMHISISHSSILITYDLHVLCDCCVIRMRF